MLYWPNEHILCSIVTGTKTKYNIIIWIIWKIIIERTRWVQLELAFAAVRLCCISLYVWLILPLSLSPGQDAAFGQGYARLRAKANNIYIDMRRRVHLSNRHNWIIARNWFYTFLYCFQSLILEMPQEFIRYRRNWFDKDIYGRATNRLCYPRNFQ